MHRIQTVLGMKPAAIAVSSASPISLRSVVPFWPLRMVKVSVIVTGAIARSPP